MISKLDKLIKENEKDIKLIIEKHKNDLEVLREDNLKLKEEIACHKTNIFSSNKMFTGCLF